MVTLDLQAVKVFRDVTDFLAAKEKMPVTPNQETVDSTD